MAERKRVTVYDKNGNGVEVLSSTVSQYLKKGFSKTTPKAKTESEKK